MAKAYWVNNGKQMLLELNGTTHIFTENEWLSSISRGRKYDRESYKMKKE